MYAVEIETRSGWEVRAFCSSPEQAWEAAEQVAATGKKTRVTNERGAPIERPAQHESQVSKPEDRK